MACQKRNSKIIFTSKELFAINKLRSNKTSAFVRLLRPHFTANNHNRNITIFNIQSSILEQNNYDVRSRAISQYDMFLSLSTCLSIDNFSRIVSMFSDLSVSRIRLNFNQSLNSASPLWTDLPVRVIIQKVHLNCTFCNYRKLGKNNHHVDDMALEAHFFAGHHEVYDRQIAEVLRI